MSKFYYQGKIQQENYLSPNDIFLRSIFGKYQLMILEAILFLFFGIFSLVIYFYPNNPISSIPNIYTRVFGSILIGLGIINLITYYFIIKKEYGLLLKVISFLYLIIGTLIVIFPALLESFLYRILASVLLSIGIITLMRRGEKSFNQKIVSTLLIMVGLFFLFAPPYKGINNLGFFILMGLFGLYLLYNSIKFRKVLKNYEDEQKGFTDYKIE